MFVLSSEIEIAGRRFTRVNHVEIVKSRKVLEDTATIRLPATARLVRTGDFISEVETAKVFNVGDPVKIRLGYDGNLRTEFEGYVKKIKPGMPLEIECEDAVWVLKRKNMKEAFKNTDLGTILESIVQGTPISLVGEIPAIRFKEFYMRNVSAAAALQKIKDEYGLTVFLKNNELRVGLREENDGTVVKYEVGTNVIETDLEWKSEADTRLKIRAIHWRKNNTKLTVEAGDADGELRTLYFYDIEDESQLKKLAEQEAKKYRFTGYDGGFTAFLVPVAEQGNVARLRDPNFGERAGDYLIDKVTTTFGVDGARRKIELGLKVSTNG